MATVINRFNAPTIPPFLQAPCGSATLMLFSSRSLHFPAT